MVLEGRKEDDAVPATARNSLIGSKVELPCNQLTWYTVQHEHATQFSRGGGGRKKFTT